MSRPRITRRGDGARVRVTVSLSPDEADALTRAAGGERKRAAFIREAALDSAASHPSRHDDSIARHAAENPGAPCLGCRYGAVRAGRYTCRLAHDPGAWRYRDRSGALTSAGGLPVDRTLACPEWVPKVNL